MSSQYLALPPSCNLQSMLRSPAPDAPLMSEAALPAVTPRGRQAKNLAVEGVSSAQHATRQTCEMHFSALWCNYWREGGKVCKGSICRDALPVLVLAFLFKHIFVRILSQDSEALDLCCKTDSRRAF